ncbi:hypothetical protein [Demequina lignilytica]|uniref:Lipoprotein n=1 Tax=Demequina lignilytica TaxID=3051663 RepID=A0AAW7M967_9MICO|nr:MULTISPECIES: hypothetical protein [unclassified Demequina]MDN4477598.1 hypothetical protein [Demequina sp. SYSU T00039-1]MDN4483643.1 hypothetical protein [Demequina sp. SYSU T0a273]MDN4488051.1 hypothetical protein [Demequina sp. SYSU T00039]MDN4490491.1 hypothetical protein [Demequina sp. SYSU T00068]
MSFRRRLAVIAASSLLLAGCAVPGQGAAPGVAAEYDGTTLTTAGLDQLAAAWAEDSDGLVAPTRDQVATYALIGPAAVAATEDTDSPITTGVAANVASAWFEYVGVTDAEISDEVVEQVREILAVYVLSLTDEDTQAQLAEIAADVEDSGLFSPRLGDFSAEALSASMADAQTQASNLGLGTYTFIMYTDVSGFSAPDVSWAARD